MLLCSSLLEFWQTPSKSSTSLVALIASCTDHLKWTSAEHCGLLRGWPGLTPWCTRSGINIANGIFFFLRSCQVEHLCSLGFVVSASQTALLVVVLGGRDERCPRCWNGLHGPLCFQRPRPPPWLIVILQPFWHDLSISRAPVYLHIRWTSHYMYAVYGLLNQYTC